MFGTTPTSREDVAAETQAADDHEAKHAAGQDAARRLGLGELVVHPIFDHYGPAGGQDSHQVGLVVAVDTEAGTAVVAWLREFSTAVPADELHTP